MTKNNLYQKIDSWMDQKIEISENKKEQKKWNKLIKKVCKKQNIKNELLIKMYVNVQNQILSLVNKKSIPVNCKQNLKYAPFFSIIKQRIYFFN